MSRKITAQDITTCPELFLVRKLYFQTMLCGYFSSLSSERCHASLSPERLRFSMSFLFHPHIAYFQVLKCLGTAAKQQLKPGTQDKLAKHSTRTKLYCDMESLDMDSLSGFLIFHGGTDGEGPLEGILFDLPHKMNITTRPHLLLWVPRNAFL